MRMKILPALLIFCIVYTVLPAQNKTYQIKADTVRIFSNCDTAELKLENRTRTVLNGVLTNKGNGVTEFRKIMLKLNDSTYVIGGDTLKVAATIDAGKLNNLAWLLGGNTVGTEKGIGTMDNFDLPILVGSFERMRLRTNGNLLIGTPTDIGDRFQLGGNMSVTGSAVFGNTVCIGDRALIGRTNIGITSATAGYTPLEFLGTPLGQAHSMFEFNAFDAGDKAAYSTENAIVRIKSGWGNMNTNEYGVSTLAIEPHVNISQGTGTIVRGIYYNPSVTTLNGGTHIAFQNTLGSNIFNSVSGNTLIGTSTDDGNKLQVNGNTKTSGFTMATGAAAGYVFVSDATGNASWQTAATPSDFNLKENITVSNFNANKLFGLRVKDFNYKSDKNKTRYTGLIAQEVKTVLPELVLGKEGSYSIDYVKMVPYLLKAIQEQQGMIQQQQEMMRQQQKEIDSLLEQMKSLKDHN